MDTKATVTPCVIICGENGLNDDVFLINAGGSSSGGDGGGSGFLNLHVAGSGN